MKYDEDYRSSNVQDLRGRGGGAAGGLGLLFMLGRRFGIGGVVVGLLVLGGLQFCGGGGLGLSSGGGSYEPSAREEALVGLVSTVLDDAQRVWTQQFADRGMRYEEATLKLFSGTVPSACGRATSATGPFYCPADQDVYIDLSFYELLRDKLGAPGDFAQAYVIAHEVGHHVQNLQGNLNKGRDEGAAGGSVRVELQADCYAGIWAHDTRKRDVLEAGDIEEALRAAQAIGDDALQAGAGGSVRPETFTHGTSAQRKKWFEIGLRTGSMDACDTFSARDL
ncbi:MAG: neutral zinc metallopeptidase [Nannocystaceae bacterium]|nr:neutral zinc metallopeptidase [bacterium]